MTAPPLRYLVAADDKASATFQRIRGEIASLKTSTEGLGRVLGPLGPQLAGAFTVAAVGAWINRTIEGVDALNDLADATGDSVENLSALEDIALRTGTSMETAGDAVIKLNKALIEGRRDPNSVAGQAIKNLGLDVKELMALSPVERLQAVGRALNSFGGENKLEYTLALLGRSAAVLAPLLKDLGEAGELQAKVTTKQAEEAEKLRKQWYALEKNGVDLGRTLASVLVPAANEFFDVLQGKGAGEIHKALAVPLQTALVLGANVSFVLKQMGVEIGGLAAQAAAVSRLDFKGAASIGDMMKEDAKAAREEFDKFERRLLGLGDAPQASYSNEGRNYTKRTERKLPALEDGNTKIAKTRKEQIDEDTQALASYVAGLSRAIEGEKNLSAEQQALNFLKSIGLLGENEQVRQLVLGLAAEKDMREELAGQAKLEAAARTELIAQQVAEQERWKRIVGDTQVGRLATLQDEIAFINKMTRNGADNATLWAQAIQGAVDRYKAGLEDIKDSGKDAAGELALVFSSAAGKALEDWQGVGALLQGILADLAQIGTRELITKPLSGWLTDALSGFSWGGLFGGGRAAGGPVSAGRMYEVNERGPGELFNVGSRQYLLAGRNGSITPAGAGGGITVQQTNYFGAGVSRNELAAWSQATKRQTIAALADAQRRGYAVGATA